MDWRERLLAYLAARLPSADRLELARISGMPAGASNDTVAFDLRITCGETVTDVPLVLRPQRPDGILAPYDVARQFAIMRALKDTAVPVPTVAWWEPDDAPLGVPFFVMERVRGDTLPLFWYGRSPRLMAAAEALTVIHSVDWRAAGLGFLVPPGELPPPVDTELAPWRARGEMLRIGRAPLLRALGDYLRRNQPRDARHAFLHGDPNPGNYLFQGDRVVGVLDWEVAGIGDPRSDLGFYAALNTIFAGNAGEDGRTLLSDAYVEVTGIPLHNLDYYEATGLYRMAVVMAGWAGRWGTPGGGYGLDAIARRLSVLLGPRWEA
jgi:aminoglycoside phosphotransferase (APT) family kinase protein